MAVLAGLLLFGRWSDVLGRRAVTAARSCSRPSSSAAGAGASQPQRGSVVDAHDPQRSRVVSVGGAAARAVPAAAARAIVGLDRYDTARRIAARFEPTAQLRSVGLAGGTDWPDALVGAAAMGTYGGPLLLTSRDELEATALQAITALNSGPAQVRRGFVFGGEGRVSVRVLEDVAALLKHEAPV